VRSYAGEGQQKFTRQCVVESPAVERVASSSQVPPLLNEGTPFQKGKSLRKNKNIVMGQEKT
jgi:hypothetical protein